MQMPLETTMTNKMSKNQTSFTAWLSDRIGENAIGDEFNTFFAERNDVAPWSLGDDIFDTINRLPTDKDVNDFVMSLMLADSDFSDEYCGNDYDPVDSGDVIYIGDNTYMSSASDAISDDPWDLV